MIIQKKGSNSISPDEMAQFRYGVIAPVVQGLHEDGSNIAYFRRVASSPFVLPDGSSAVFKAETLEDWYHRYKKHGLDALRTKTRSDNGKTRSLSDEAIQRIHKLREEFRKINATQVHIKLIEEELIRPTLSVVTIQRYMKKNRSVLAPPPTGREIKAYETAFFGAMWQADTSHMPAYTNEDDQRVPVFLIAIIDDHSRLVVGAELFEQDNSINFQKVFKNAVETYGIPNKLYVDNGGPYDNKQLSMICAAIGSTHSLATPHHPAGKGKIERLFYTLNSRFFDILKVSKIHSLEEYNRLLRDHILKHNRSYHSTIETTPIQRYELSRINIRIPKSKEWLDHAFCNVFTRKVRKDGTITINKVLWDVPQQFIGSTVELRFLPLRPECSYVYYDGKKYPITTTDKVANSSAKRRNFIKADYREIEKGEGNNV